MFHFLQKIDDRSMLVVVSRVDRVGKIVKVCLVNLFLEQGLGLL